MEKNGNERIPMAKEVEMRLPVRLRESSRVRHRQEVGWEQGIDFLTFFISNSRMIYAFSRDDTMRRTIQSCVDSHNFPSLFLFKALQFPMEPCQCQSGLSSQYNVVILHHCFSSRPPLFDQLYCLISGS